MRTPPLFPTDARTVRPSSLSAFLEVQQSLPLRDLLIVASVDDYCKAKGYPNVTGREAASWLGRDVTSVRPSLTRAKNAGWLVTHPVRKSRDPREGPCEPYAVAVPREAIDRAIQVARNGAKARSVERANLSSKHAENAGLCGGESVGLMRTQERSALTLSQGADYLRRSTELRPQSDGTRGASHSSAPVPPDTT